MGKKLTALAKEENSVKKTQSFPRLKAWFKNNYAGYLYVMPVILGILFFTLLPMITSLVYSFADVNLRGQVENFGFQNFTRMFTKDLRSFTTSLRVTAVYTVINIPLTMILSFGLSMFLNQPVKGIRFFRVLYYLPCLIPTVISGLIWRNFTDVTTGLGNAWIRALGLPEWGFFQKSSTSLPTLIFLNLFGLGGGMILWLAQLKQIPAEMYESASIEGAGWFTRTFRITIPMCTPMIFYNLIMGVIGSLQTFGNVFVLTGGGMGIDNSLSFYVIKIYDAAFGSYQKMGYASALSWVLFLIIGLLTLVVFKTSKWVFYGEES